MNEYGRWEGYIDMGADGVKSLELYFDPEFGAYAYVDGDLCDDIGSLNEFLDIYGDEAYLSLDDFKTGKAIPVEDVWPTA